MGKTITVECDEEHCEDQDETSCPLYEKLPTFRVPHECGSVGPDLALAEALRDLGMSVTVALRDSDTTTISIDNEDARRLLPIVRAAR